jgi:cytochrome c peroxidase
MLDLLIPLSHSISASADMIAVVMHPLSHTLNEVAQNTMFLAQHTDADLVAEFQKAFKQFVESGQVWAMLIGLIIGYFFRALTTYG